MKDLNIGGKYSFADFGYFSLGVYNSAYLINGFPLFDIFDVIL